jgi:putative restriction endonuclease
LCRLRHLELLDAAHITPDTDPEGEPHVSNGLALCKLHHAAFDGFFFTVTPEYRVEVRPSILAESDGPMLIVGLQQIHGQAIQLPSKTAQRPEQSRLERRYELFLQAS